jgi:cation diffusion facilitator family transporter
MPGLEAAKPPKKMEKSVNGNSKQGVGFENTATDESVTTAIEIRRARRRAAVSVSLNLTLAFGKGLAGLLAGSSALIGDAIHSATDVIASAATFTGLWLAGKQHPSFPYGLYKAETVATLVTSVAVILAGYEIARRALLGPDTLPEVRVALPAAVAALIITIGFGLYQLRVGRRLHSIALEADARDYLADGLSTAVVVASLIGAYFGLRLDRWAAGTVAAFVFWSGGQLLWRAVRDLMDEAIDRDTEREIIGLVESHARVERVEKCLSRTAGGRFIVELDVIIRSHSQELADSVAHLLEEEIRRRFPRVVMASIKPHSRRSLHLQRLTPVKAPGGDIEDHFAKAPWFLHETIDRKSQKIVSQEYIQNPHVDAETKRGFLVGRWLLDFKPDQVVAVEEKEGTAFALLKEAGVEVLLAKNSKVDSKVAS